MSGGVDSSVAAALLVEQGWDVVGVTMTLLPRGETGFGCCGSASDVEDAKRVCDRLGISHYTADLSELFEAEVVRPYVEARLSAQTPNPCVECNRSVKFGRLMGLAEAWGCAKVATGHYARVSDGRLLKALDREKDQSYFLYTLTSREIARVDFPIGELSKPEVRRLARGLGLRVAGKPESQETCFVPGCDVRGFVAARPEAAGSEAFSSGEIRDTSGRIRGRHLGLAAYTVGQRKGLGVSSPDPLYVVRLEPETNALVVGAEDEVYSSALEVGRVSWTRRPPVTPLRCAVRLRHRHPPAQAELVLRGEAAVSVRFNEAQRAPAPGQAAVFYDGDEVLGGGTILIGGAS